MNRKERLTETANAAGLYVRTYSPGDGITRYRFFRMDESEPESDYFGPESGVYTALGISEAEAFVSGAITGRYQS